MRVAGSAHAEAALIADTLRRAHLVDGVPWSQLAVIVRSPSAAAALPRALAGAGVPVAAAQLAGPVADQPAAQALLMVLAATADGLDARAGGVVADRADRPGRPGDLAPAASGVAPQLGPAISATNSSRR